MNPSTPCPSFFALTTSLTTQPKLPMPNPAPPNTRPRGLVPHGLPSELFNEITTHLADDEVAPLLRVNSAWYNVSISHMYRSHRIDEAAFRALEAGESLDRYAPSGRPIFRVDWLSNTNTLEIVPHTAAQCAAAAKHFRHSYRALRLPLGPQDPFHDGECAFFKNNATLVLTNCTFDRVMEPVVPPPDVWAPAHVFEFSPKPVSTALMTEIFDDMDFSSLRFREWFRPLPPVAGRYIFLLPPQGQNEDETCIVRVMQEMCMMAGAYGPVPTTFVGGFMDVRSTTVVRDLDQPLLDLVQSETDGPASMYEIFQGILRIVVDLFVDNLMDWSEMAEDELPSAKKAHKQQMYNNIIFKAAEDVLESGELDSVIPRQQIRRAVYGRVPAVRL
ncbi:uncharacterized protein COLE_07872 [Cutaneotrichosporon oleaginosum]|uniref:uncharacterized protein n=1 Tax=Cutaneotrichosporon oleaginosum TaxID=879819 RepID=UPI0013268AB4|nr:hypothetical protein COLE_07872 [Cutaneotrichosporon oleaginosum]